MVLEGVEAAEVDRRVLEVEAEGRLLTGDRTLFTTLTRAPEASRTTAIETSSISMSRSRVPTMAVTGPNRRGATGRDHEVDAAPDGRPAEFGSPFPPPRDVVIGLVPVPVHHARDEKRAAQGLSRNEFLELGHAFSEAPLEDARAASCAGGFGALDGIERRQGSTDRFLAQHPHTRREAPDYMSSCR